jgi:hypothetical protein
VESLCRRLLANRVPDLWLTNSFPSVLPLRRYMDDVVQRVAFLSEWVCEKKPAVVRLGAFYHPEEFLTSILQVYARKHVVPFDSLSWRTIVASADSPEPEEGILVEGLALEGAKWDGEANSLTECGQRELENFLPVLHLLPTQEKERAESLYECPVYRTQNRGTGALDLPNYIFSIFLPCGADGADHWVQRSVAAFITI